MEQAIIPPVAKHLLRQELTPERQLRLTNKSNNEIYVVTAHEAPNVMQEIGRLREIAFREAGGGTGKSVDIDDFDTCENCYKQLIVWNPEAEEIIGGYRYIFGSDWELDEKGQPKLATSSISRSGSSRNTCPTPLNWGVRSCRPTTKTFGKHEKHFRARQSLGRHRCSDRAQSAREIFLRKSDDVPLVCASRSRHDSLLFTEAFWRCRKPDSPDETAEN